MPPYRAAFAARYCFGELRCLPRSYDIRHMIQYEVRESERCAAARYVMRDI